jgi:hypothetical protein
VDRSLAPDMERTRAMVQAGQIGQNTATHVSALSAIRLG